MIPVDLTLQVETEGVTAPSQAQWQTYFEQWVNALEPQPPQRQAYEVSLLLTTDTEIQNLNATYRHYDAPTDVLAFAALEWEGPTNPALADLPTNLGDIVISVETAAHQAADQGHRLEIELAWLASHGLLHLLGWDHPDVKQLNQMLEQQARLVSLVGLEPPSWSAEALGYLEEH